MASIVTTKFRVHNAQQFAEAFSETANNGFFIFVSVI